MQVQILMQVLHRQIFVPDLLVLATCGGIINQKQRQRRHQCPNSYRVLNLLSCCCIYNIDYVDPTFHHMRQLTRLGVNTFSHC